MFFTNLFQANLTSQFIAKNIEYYPTTNSTMNDLWELVENNKLNKLLVITDYQQKGKGRFNNNWYSKPGNSITCSLSLKPIFKKKEFGLHAILIPVAIVQAIKELLYININIKWPNDLFYQKKKVGGILIESKQSLNQLNIGIGINVNENFNDFPKEIQHSAISLKEIKGHPIQREPLLAFIINKLEQLIKSPNNNKLINTWRQSCLHINKKISFKYNNEIVMGIFKKINSKGQAIIEYNDNNIIYDGAINQI